MNRCVRCGNEYQDNNESILKGCSCGSKFFLYVRSQTDDREIKEIEKKLQEKNSSLEVELVKGLEQKKSVSLNREMKVVKPKLRKDVGISKSKFGIETIKIPNEGVYEINIDALMKRKPLIVLEKGEIYLVQLPSVFEKVKPRI